MQPEFWHGRWERGETGWHQEEINLHLREHWPRLRLAPEGRVFVPLCGKSLDLLWLAGEGHRVLGVELSPLAVDAFFAGNALTPAVSDDPPFRRYRLDELEILCGDFFDVTQDHLSGISAVYDRASLIALPPDMRPRYARHLAGVVGPDTRVLLITLDYDQSEMAGPPFSVDEAEVCALFGEGFEVQAVGRLDLWAEHPRYRERGMTRLWERVYTLRPRTNRGE
jgi:thiopurine S-methyltransferase